MFLNPRFLLAAKPTSFVNLLERELEEIGEVSSIDTSSTVFSDPGACVAYVSLAKPDILIHIQFSEEKSLNPLIPLSLQHGLVGTDALFVHISDINLFSGSQKSLHTETDFPDSEEPKAQQEIKAQINLKNDFVHTVIIRSGRILSSTLECPLKRFINTSLGRRHITLDHENRISVISESQASRFLKLLIKKAVADADINGIYNIACLGTPLEFEWQSLALQIGRKIRPDLVWPKTSLRKGQPQEKNLGLDCTKFQLTTGTILPDWQDAVIEATVNQVGLIDF